MREPTKERAGRPRAWWRLLAVVAALAMIAAACGDDDDTTAGGAADCDGTDEVALQLQWFAQAQFAGYYAAVDQGFYADQCLDVTILEGGVDIVPQQQLASGAADYAISWVPRALVSRSEGVDVVNVAQVFQRSGTLQVSFADAGISGPADFEGRKIGSWGFGNEFELLAGGRTVGLEPDADYEVVQQNFDMQALISGEIDAAQAMIYNEYAQVLETVNPDTGELYQPDDLTVIDWNDVGTAMLQDAIWADGTKVGEADYDDQTTRFIAASIQGWAWCRDNAEACVDVVLDNGPTLGRSHQTWQLNEISNLIWPSPGGAGVMDQGLWDQTIDVATSEGVLAEAPDDAAFTTEFAEAAIELLGDLDVNGSGWSKAEVELLENGE
ncbi:MAG: ABC transporter substrate-binding protein [Actinomycetota bacterium]